MKLPTQMCVYCRSEYTTLNCWSEVAPEKMPTLVAMRMSEVEFDHIDRWVSSFIVSIFDHLHVVLSNIRVISQAP